MRSNRPMAWRKTLVGTFARGSAALVLAVVLSAGRATADPVALVATQAANPVSSFTLEFDFGAFVETADARISHTDFELEIDTDLGAARFAQYQQTIEPLILPGGFNTGNIRVEVVPGSSSGTLNVLTGEFTTEELYAVYFDGDLSAYHLTSPVILPSASAGTVRLSALTGGNVLMAWAGTTQLPNPFDPAAAIPLNYTCAVTAEFAPQPVTLLQLAMIPHVVNMDLPVGLEKNLLTTLDAALISVDADRNRNAANFLNVFVKKVEAQQGKWISAVDADALVSDAKGAMLLLEVK